MAHDSLQSLLRLRRMALDEAHRSLVLCLAHEEATGRALSQAEAAIAREMATAEASSEDGEVEAFAAWLPVGREALHNAEVAQNGALKETALARAALTLARAAVEATEDLIERRAASQRQGAERRAQAVLDEIGLRPAQSGSDGDGGIDPPGDAKSDPG